MFSIDKSLLKQTLSVAFSLPTSEPFEGDSYFFKIFMKKLRIGYGYL